MANAQALEAKNESKLKRFLRRAFVGSVILAALSIILLTAYITFWPFEIRTPERTTNVLADDSQLLTSIYVENRRPVPLEAISPYFLEAVIAVEDSRFYQHRGIDFIRLGKAILVNIKTRSKAQGASTITQQLARNLYLTLEKKYSRKIQEAILALQIEQHLDKDTILEMYVNQVYMGHGLYGIQNAAQFYYGKDAKDLTLAQATMLAGVIQIPEVYSPVNNFEAGRRRQKIVLQRLVAVGKLTEEEAAAVYEKEDEVRPKPTTPQTVSAGYIRGAIIKHLDSNYLNGAQYAYKGGLTIQTTINSQLQQAAEWAVAEGLKDLENRGRIRPGVAEVALIALDPKTGEIKAMVGGRNYRASTFNRVFAERPPGSVFKPIVYAEALRQGKVTLASPILCERTEYHIPGQERPYVPADFGGTYHDEELTVRRAITISDNVIAVKTINEVGPQQVVELANAIGIPLQSRDAVLSLALGTVSVKPIDLAVGFATLANGGYRVEPLMIKSITDPQGRVWEQATSSTPQPVLDERVTWLITDALKDVLNSPEGTGRSVRQWYSDPRAAIKTGTTGIKEKEGDAYEKVNNAWIAGYTPDLVTVVYLGADNFQQAITDIRNVSGGSLVGPIWGRFMAKAEQILARSEDWPLPEGITQAQICNASGELASFRCPQELRQQEYFLQEFAPTQSCSVHGGSWFAPDDGRPWWERLFPYLFPRP
ncbi:MAG: penicillin-binding protein [Firmicutes bacterium]|nr:penicillin-binding protein [Bacillota bacterium]